MDRIRKSIAKANLPNSLVGKLILPREVTDVCISDSGKRWAAILSTEIPEIIYGVVQNGKLKIVARASDGCFPVTIHFGIRDNQILTSNNNGTVSCFEIRDK